MRISHILQQFRSRTNTLGARLAFWFAVTSVLLTLVLAEVIQLATTETLKKQIGEKLAELAYQTTNKLDNGMYERYREVGLLALRPLFADETISKAEKQALLDQIQSSYPHYAWMGVVDLQGKVLLATGGLLEGVDVSKRPWFGNALNGIYTGDLHEAKLLAKLLKAPDGEPKRFVDFAFPYRNGNGQVVGVVGVHMSWEWAREVERTIFEPIRKRSNVEAMIVSRDGTVMLGSKSMQGTVIDLSVLRNAGIDDDLHAVQEWSDGKQYLTGFSKSQGYGSYKGLGWSVVVRQDVTEAFAPVRQIQQRVLWSGMGIAALFSLFGILNARRITRPLAELTTSAEKIRLGKATTFEQPKCDYAEVHSMAQSFTALLSSLQKVNTQLETRVRERTDALAFSEHRLRSIANSVPALIGYIDADERYRFCNITYRHWFGEEPDELIGMTVKEVFGDAFYEKAEPYIRKVMLGRFVSFEISRQLHGVTQPLAVRYQPEINDDGVVCGFYVLANDITELKTIQMNLEHDILHDALTGLPNRLGCLGHLQKAIARVGRSGKPLAVMFLDVDRFKQINDSFGHGIGDEVLREFSKRLRSAMRETDIVARLSGDEFVVVAEGLTEANDANLVAEKIIESLADPFIIQHMPRNVSASIGVTIYRSGPTTAEDLLKQADAAMYDAKRTGRDRVVRFGESAITS